MLNLNNFDRCCSSKCCRNSRGRSTSPLRGTGRPGPSPASSPQLPLPSTTFACFSTESKTLALILLSAASYRQLKGIGAGGGECNGAEMEADSVALGNSFARVLGFRERERDEILRFFPLSGRVFLGIRERRRSLVGEGEG